MASKTKKKTQAAMEFLVTYGWAIVLVLVVIGALSYFGVLSPAKLLPDKCNFQVGFSCVDYSVSTEGYHINTEIGGVANPLTTNPPNINLINFDLMNNLGEDVYVTKVNITGKDIDCIQVQYDKCDSADTSFIDALIVAANSGNPLNYGTHSCFSINESCSPELKSYLCQDKEPKDMVRWPAGQKLKSHIGYDSEYLSLWCSKVPKKGQKTNAQITIEYTKSDPGISGSLRHIEYGEFFITVS